MQTEVASLAKDTVATVQQVTADTSPDDVISTLTPAVHHLEAASSTTAAILSEVNAAMVPCIGDRRDWPCRDEKDETRGNGQWL